MLYYIYPDKDTFITDKYYQSVKMTGSNFGFSEFLSVFSLKGEFNTSSLETSRTLLSFDLSELQNKISQGKVNSGSCQYYLKLYNVNHYEEIPYEYYLSVYPISSSWKEGRGIDTEYFSDFGQCNWESANSLSNWNTVGGDFYQEQYSSSSQFFKNGDENLEMNVTTIVNYWLDNQISNYGFMIKLSASYEITGSNTNSYYNKKFYSRHSDNQDKLPRLECRWDNQIKDNRGNFYYNTTGSLYLYNIVKGIFTDLSTGSLALTVNVCDKSGSVLTNITASRVETGIYSTSFAVASGSAFSSSYTGSYFYDSWKIGTKIVKSSSSFSASELFVPENIWPTEEFNIFMPNLKSEYEYNEEAKLRVLFNSKNWNLSVYESSSIDVGGKLQIQENSYYGIRNKWTDNDDIQFFTSSNQEWTKLSYDQRGNFFDFWMNNLVKGNEYKFIYLVNIDGKKEIYQKNDFVFKVI